MSQEWNIKERNNACQACGTVFPDNGAFFTRLDFAEGNYVRRDFCPACWKEPAKAGALSVWKSVFKRPPPPAPEPIQKETAESLLRHMMETDDPANRNAIFILAVMLERRRILAERDVQVREDGVKIRVYEHRKTGESFMVPDPELRLAELKQVQAEVITLLGGGNGAVAASAEPAAAAEDAARQDGDSDAGS